MNIKEGLEWLCDMLINKTFLPIWNSLPDWLYWVIPIVIMCLIFVLLTYKEIRHWLSRKNH
jgi:type II secretory pathway component PulF